MSVGCSDFELSGECTNWPSSGQGRPSPEVNTALRGVRAGRQVLGVLLKVNELSSWLIVGFEGPLRG